MKRTFAIFDMDGTLLDTLDDLTTSVNYCMKKYGQPQHTREEVRCMVGSGSYVLVARALPGGRDNPCYEDCIQDYLPYYRAHMMDQTAPFDGIEELLDGLTANGYICAIVSNKFDAAVKGLTRRFFGDTIPVAIGLEEDAGMRKKPAPDTVFAAMRDLKALPEQCLYIGDSEVDIQTAANAGIPCISVTWGFKTRTFLEEHGAETIVDTPQELLGCILSYEEQSIKETGKTGR